MQNGVHREFAKVCIEIKLLVVRTGGAWFSEKDRREKVVNKTMCDTIEKLNSEYDINRFYNKFIPYFKEYIDAYNKESDQLNETIGVLKEALKTMAINYGFIIDSSCCKYCTIGKACGDSCINVNYECYKGKGCACNL